MHRVATNPSYPLMRDAPIHFSAGLEARTFAACRHKVKVFGIGQANPANGQSIPDNKSLPIKQFQKIQGVAIRRALVHELLDFVQARACLTLICPDGEPRCRL